jgi:hypothetical protein
MVNSLRVASQRVVVSSHIACGECQLCQKKLSYMCEGVTDSIRPEYVISPCLCAFRAASNPLGLSLLLLAKAVGDPLLLFPKVRKRNTSGYVKAQPAIYYHPTLLKPCLSQVPAADFNCLKVPDEVPDEKGSRLFSYGCALERLTSCPTTSSISLRRVAQLLPL